jgi:hypothetical protein
MERLKVQMDQNAIMFRLSKNDTNPDSVGIVRIDCMLSASHADMASVADSSRGG